ncbi:hypothetical protein ACFWVP_19840 [Streptomyces sp. NPDC058637]|uniref:hypothetical protein n=1 Tax=Streptomyces sp. NPDC058637 TaxID=3346569 RepID=UPI00365ECEE4
MYRYYLRQTVVGDGRRPARTPLRAAQERAGVPAGRWMGRGLAALGLALGEEVTESQLRNLYRRAGPPPGRGPDRSRRSEDEVNTGNHHAASERAGLERRLRGSHGRRLHRQPLRTPLLDLRGLPGGGPRSSGRRLPSRPGRWRPARPGGVRVRRPTRARRTGSTPTRRRSATRSCRASPAARRGPRPCRGRRCEWACW